MHAALDLWYHDPQVTTPILKFFSELVNNRGSRLQFDAHSPNGILLFREVSKLIVNYGSKNLMLEKVSDDQLYPLKLKGRAICFQIMKSALIGSYVNFGVFQLYGDSALDNVLNVIIKLLITIPVSTVLVSL